MAIKITVRPDDVGKIPELLRERVEDASVDSVYGDSYECEFVELVELFEPESTR